MLASVRNAAWVFGPQSGAKMVAGLDSVCDRPRSHNIINKFILKVSFRYSGLKM